MNVNRRRARGRSQRGQILVIYALCSVVLFGMMAVAVDGGYGLLQNRRAQNAADFAAYAGAQQLNGSSVCNGPAPIPSMAEMVSIVEDEINANAPAVASSWTGAFLDSSGHLISGSSFTSASTSGYPPPGACGVTVDTNPSWNTFFAGVLGYPQLSGNAGATVGITTQGSPVSIVALNKIGPHVVLGGGSGTFTVEGDMYLDTTVSNQPWTQTSQGWAWDDAVDAKSASNLNVYGTVHTAAGNWNGTPLWPLDWCFDGQPPEGEGTSVPGDPSAPPQSPIYSPACHASNGAGVKVAYNHIDPNWNPINDPLGGAGAPSDPAVSSTDITCPGLSSLPQYSSLASGTITFNGKPTLEPGEYTSPVRITGSMTFGDCSVYGGGAYPGIYRFDRGLWIDPGSGNQVTGSNVVLSAVNPYPVAGNVPGSLVGGVFQASGAGDGAPCLPSGTMSSGPSGSGGTPVAEVNSGDAASACGGTSPTQYGTIAYGDSSFQPTGLYGTGENYSVMIGGQGTVTLTGPTVGEYAGVGGDPGIILYQDPNVQANLGFDGEPGDSASITVNGVVYDGSLASYGSQAPLDYWDGPGGGIPFYAGGTMQSGNGAGWSSGGPPESTGSVTVNGTCVVDQFNTDGQTTVTIAGQPFALPSGSAPALIG